VKEEGIGGGGGHGKEHTVEVDHEPCRGHAI
jgi:hypothetical protein